ncbi:phosphotransferase family protein [Patulibacter brassicae]|uniref:Phosphotransferase family protein n=1 Tax=Patulibacter brassicae TaxID=1705717 RepID=A0ABU4VNX2_9ACTN|nr:phosphotransferase family protein [Patulibacter brassicae]MDX8153329.1 phosphotransferase family protein [Patulibacter brassicae]
MALKNTIDLQAAAQALRPWLAERFGAGEGDIEIGGIEVNEASGMSSESVLFDVTRTVDGERRTAGFVARIAPRGDGLFMDYDLPREALVMDALARHTDVPAPRVWAGDGDEALFGAPFVVMERCYGKVPPDDPPFTASGWVLDLAPEDQGRLVDNALAAIAGIHAADPVALGVQGLERQDVGATALEREIAYYERYYAWGSRGVANPTVDAGLDWIKAHLPATIGTPEDPDVISWGDARLGNMMFGEDLAVTGVFDWEMASLGPRGVDLGWFIFMNRHHSEALGLPLPPGFPDQAGTIARYEELSGHAVPDADFYVAWSAVRASIIFTRVGHYMVELGLVPPDAQMWLSNPASNLLATILDLPAPSVASSGWVTGKR